MNSKLKIAVPLALMVLAVFGITLISQYTPPEVNEAKGSKDPNGGPDSSPATEVPLRYNLRHYRYDPDSEDIELRRFPGFYEQGDQLNWVSYWVENPRAVPVEVSAKGRSCSQCSDARITIIPHEALTEFKDLNRYAAIANLTGMPDILSAMAGVRMLQTSAAKTQRLDFDHPDSYVTVPPAEGKVGTLCMLQLGFKVNIIGPKDLTANIGMRTPDMALPLQVDFKISFFGVTAFDLFPRYLDLGDYQENDTPKSGEFTYWSSTRSPDDLRPPAISSKDPYLKIDPPVKLTHTELATLSAIANPAEAKVKLRMTAGYKIRVTLLRELPPGQVARPLDIGPSERTMSVTMSGSENFDTKSIPIKANILGVIKLGVGTSLEVGDYNGRNGTNKRFEFTSDKPDLKLELDTENIKPSFLKVTLEDPVPTPGGGQLWGLKVSIEPNRGLGDFPPDSVITLKVKGSTQVIRIPIKGRGFLR